MHKRHKLGSAGISGYFCHSWQRLNYTAKEISNSFWNNPKITLVHQGQFTRNVTSNSKWVPLWQASHYLAKGTAGNQSRCPKIPNPTMIGMQTNRLRIGTICDATVTPISLLST
eukprot:1136208-Pelagomonas_calceolata.AAC.5